MKIVLLGTSSAVPTLYRSLSSTALIRDGDVFLFDCGEGTQVQLMRAGVRRSKIHSIFIGHLHGDHLYGINGLLSTLHLDNRESPLRVYGPQGLLNFLHASFRTNSLKFSYPITVQEFSRGFHGRVLEEKEFYVDAMPLDHSIFCLGWRFQEKDRPGIFNMERAEALGVPRGPMFGKLQNGNSITLKNGQTIHPEEVLGETRPGKSVAYCLDTQFSNRSIELAEGCTA
jgi:ribonuclease Z